MDPFTLLAGATVVNGILNYKATGKAADTASSSTNQAAQLHWDQYMQSREDLAPYRDVATGQRIYDPFTDTYIQEPGALQELAGYGRSKVSPSDYIPESNIPQYNLSTEIGGLPSVEGRVSDYNVTGDIPEFDQMQFDMYKDPGYEFRKSEQERGINRNMAGMGKLTSGNRLEEIMQRSGDLASEEYGNAYGRFLTDYGIGRENEATQFGRDLTGYEAGRANELTRYGFDTDAYNRAYGRNTDEYGRGIDQLNAGIARESQMYGRGVDQFGRVYGQEGDYLNRLASLSNIGQTATGNTVNAGANYASNAGNAMIQGGNAQAAGIVGQSNAITGGVNNLAYLYGMSQQPQYYPPPTPGGFAGYYGTNPGSQQTSMLYNQMYGPMSGSLR